MDAKINEELVKEAINVARKAESLTRDRKSETYLGVLIAHLMGAAVKYVGGSEVGERQARPRVKQRSIGELFAEKKPRTDVDKVLTAGYFLEQVEGAPSFNVDDLERCILHAKERIPKNINDSVNKNIKKGTMMEAPAKKAGRKAWLLTRTGEEVAEQGFMHRPPTMVG